MTRALPVPPDAVHWITERLEEAGFETWTVGGAVRDALLGTPGGDWDLATRATPKEMQRLFRRTVPIGVDHGTVGVLKDGTMYEVTTFRKDVETDGRHAVVAFADSIDDDLSRRDFTINAIAWHASKQSLHDPFDGAADLDRGILRTVGRAEDRFREDYLRILRAFRFAGKYGLRIDAAAWAAACDLVGGLPDLSAERVREELLKILDADPDPTAALHHYRDSGALAVLYAELHERGTQSDGEAWWADRLAIVARLPTGRPMLRLAALLRDVEASRAAAMLVRLRLSNRDTDWVARVAGAAPIPALDATSTSVRVWLARFGPDLLNPVVRIELARARARGPVPRGAEIVAGWRQAKDVLRTAPPLTVSDLAIDGRELKRLGLRPGPLFGRILEALLEWVLEDPERNDATVLGTRAVAIARTLEGA
ncbi:MAG: CCA tRNA nucleotidyltransferase [Gemmatimonadota bacterium]